MKRISTVLAIACLVFACNNSADNKSANKDSGTSIMDADSAGTKDSSTMDHSSHEMPPLDSNGRQPRN